MNISREVFLCALNTVQPGISSQDTIPQSSCFVFQDGKVLTFNQEISCSASSGLDKDFTGAIPHKPLLESLSKLKDETLQVFPKDGYLILKGKTDKVKLKVQEEIQLALDLLEAPGKFAKLPEEFLTALDIAHHSCHTDHKGKWDKCCVHVTKKHVEATDELQLTRYQVSLGTEEPFMIRKESARAVVGLGATEFNLTDNWIHFRSGELVISCRKYVEEDLGLDEFLDSPKGEKISLPKGLVDACELAEKFSSEISGENRVLVKLQDSQVRVLGVGLSGQAESLRKLRYSGPKISFFIAPKLLSDIVTKHQEVLVSKDILRVEAGPYTFAAWLLAEEEIQEPKPSSGNGKARKKQTVSEED